MDIEHENHWAELDPDLLDEILTHVNYGDYFRLRTVCKKWSLEIPKNPEHVKNPWLIRPFNHENEIARPLLNFGENRVYHLNLPETQKTFFCGSYYEWLVTLAIDGALRILNPFTRAQFELPPLTTFPDVKAYEPDRLGAEYNLVDIAEQDEEDKEYTVDKNRMQTSHIWKIIISAPPDHDDQDLVAMAIYGEYRRLAWCRISDSRWTDVLSAEIACDYEDAIFHEGKMYVIGYGAQMSEFDIKTGLGGVIAVSIPANVCLENPTEHRKYLVETPDGLLMVIRRIEFYRKDIVCNEEVVFDHYYRTFEFEVYILSRGKWLKMNNLGNHVILLGQNSSWCAWPDSFPDAKGNRIYFTDDFRDYHRSQVIGSHDIGVFNMVDGSINHLFREEHCSWPPPVWLVRGVH